MTVVYVLAENLDMKPIVIKMNVVYVLVIIPVVQTVRVCPMEQAGKVNVDV